MSPRPTVDDLISGVRSGDRALLARAITLVESTRTGRKKPGLHEIHPDRSNASPPPGTIMCTCG